ncbi:MAG: protein kinase domain-containing protein [Aeromicrobium sp.]
MSPDVNAGETTPQVTSRRGSLVAGRYRIDSLIAAGGMGEVWRATDEVLGRVVSVKFLHPQFAADESFLERMLREARAASAINHPGVVAVYDFGRTDPEDAVPTSYIVMEYVDGPSLSQVLTEGSLGVEKSLTILEETAAALHAAHQAGVVHRDVKPGNIIMSPSGRVKLTDFGIARSQDTSTITDSGSITGTATYLSPEQASGEKATEASDLYSLGVVIYSCLSGDVPFTRDGPVAIALAHLKDPPPPLPEEIPAGVSELVMSLLEKQPNNRPVDAQAVSAQAALLRGHSLTEPVPPVATGPSPTAVAGAAMAETEPTTVAPVQEEEQEPARRDRRKLFLILGAVAAALALVAAYLVFGRGGEPVTMPNVVGMSQAEAERALESQGLKADVEVEDVPKEKADTVLSQSEEAGTTVETGSTIDLKVASGLVSLPVDKIIGSSYSEAKAMLEKLGLTAERINRPSGTKTGTVLDIQESSSRVEVDSVVTLVVAMKKKATPPPPTFSPTPTPTPKPTKSPTPTPTTTTPPPDPDPDADVDADGGGVDVDPP